MAALEQEAVFAKTQHSCLKFRGMHTLHWSSSMTLSWTAYKLKA